MISTEHKINFSFYWIWTLLGAVMGLFFLFVSVAFSKPFFLFLAVVFFGAGILTAILFYRGENKKPEYKQTPYMKNLARKWSGKKPDQHPREPDKSYRERTETKEEIPPVEILPEEEEKKVETIGELEE